MSEKHKAELKEFLGVSAIIGLIPAIVGIMTALAYINSYIFPRTEADDLKNRVTQIEVHQTSQDDQHSKDLIQIMRMLADIQRSVSGQRGSAGTGKRQGDKLLMQAQSKTAPLEDSQN